MGMEDLWIDTTYNPCQFSLDSTFNGKVSRDFMYMNLKSFKNTLYPIFLKINLTFPSYFWENMCQYARLHRQSMVFSSSNPIGLKDLESHQSQNERVFERLQQAHERVSENRWKLYDEICTKQSIPGSFQKAVT